LRALKAQGLDDACVEIDLATGKITLYTVLARVLSWGLDRRLVDAKMSLKVTRRSTAREREKSRRRSDL
jgi:hypothetical protein